MTKEYCSERKELQTQMAAKGFVLDDKLREFEQPLPVEVVGLAFQDNAEPRGSSKVNSLWEIHPAIVKIVSPRGDTCGERDFSRRLPVMLHGANNIFTCLIPMATSCHLRVRSSNLLEGA